MSSAAQNTPQPFTTPATKGKEGYAAYDLSPPKLRPARRRRTFEEAVRAINRDFDNLRVEWEDDKVVWKKKKKKDEHGNPIETDLPVIFRRMLLFLYSRSFKKDVGKGTRVDCVKDMLKPGRVQNLILQVIKCDGDLDLAGEEKYRVHYIRACLTILRYFQQNGATGFDEDMSSLKYYLRMQNYGGCFLQAACVIISYILQTHGITDMPPFNGTRLIRHTFNDEQLIKYIVKDKGGDSVAILKILEKKCFEFDLDNRDPMAINCRLLDDKDWYNLAIKYLKQGPALVSKFIVPDNFRCSPPSNDVVAKYPQLAKYNTNDIDELQSAIDKELAELTTAGDADDEDMPPLEEVEDTADAAAAADDEADFPPLYEYGEDYEKAGDAKQRAADLKSSGDWQKALDEYNIAVMAAPPSALLYTNRAKALMTLGYLKAAQRDCNLALKENRREWENVPAELLPPGFARFTTWGEPAEFIPLDNSTNADVIKTEDQLKQKWEDLLNTSSEKESTDDQSVPVTTSMSEDNSSQGIPGERSTAGSTASLYMEGIGDSNISGDDNGFDSDSVDNGEDCFDNASNGDDSDSSVDDDSSAFGEGSETVLHAMVLLGRRIVDESTDWVVQNSWEGPMQIIEFSTEYFKKSCAYLYFYEKKGRRPKSKDELNIKNFLEDLCTSPIAESSEFERSDCEDWSDYTVQSVNEQKPDPDFTWDEN